MEYQSKILILEDNSDCVEIYKHLLAPHYDLTIISQLSILQNYDPLNYKALIADMRLPDGEFLDWIMETKSDLMEKIPTVIVSSVEDMSILRNSFEWGAVDYFVKPFKNNELLVKLENILKGKALSPHAVTEDFKDDLTLIENKLFQVFLQASGGLVTREELLKTVWKKVQVNPKTLDVHLSNLRKKIQNTSYRIESQGNGWKLVTQAK